MGTIKEFQSKEEKRKLKIEETKANYDKVCDNLSGTYNQLNLKAKNGVDAKPEEVIGLLQSIMDWKEEMEKFEDTMAELGEETEIKEWN